MMLTYKGLLLAIILINIIIIINGQQETEYNITTKLLAKYEKKILPPELVIKIKITLNQIVTIDEISQIMVTSSIMEVQWTDKRLQFTDKSGIKEILIPALSIWLPDLFIINTADRNGFFNIFSNNLAAVDNLGS